MRLQLLKRIRTGLYHLLTRVIVLWLWTKSNEPFQTLGHFFAKPKDPVTKGQRTDAIYSIPCNDCDLEYIGQTKRQLCTRLKEY